MYGIQNRELKLKLSKVKYQMCGHMKIYMQLKGTVDEHIMLTIGNWSNIILLKGKLNGYDVQLAKFKFAINQ